jgi:AcrR family transcriptional regulator
MATQTELRERKKEQTREAITAAARRLFALRGFEHVTVAQIARAAEVSEKTVFNYFPTKEDLFYSRLESFEEDLLAAIRGRAHGRTIVDAFRGFLLARRGVFGRLAENGTAEALDELRTVTRVITQSPALLAREERVFARFTASLASLLAEEAGRPQDDIEPRVVATALMGVHRALIDYVRLRTLAGENDFARLARDLRVQATRAFSRLEGGLAGYGALH